MAINVAIYGDQKVQRQPLPAARVSPASNVDEAFGGGASAAAVTTAGRELQRTNQRLLGEQERQLEAARLKAQKDADDLAVEDRALQAGILKNTLHVDMQKMQGKDSLGVPDMIDKKWNEAAQKLSEGMANDTQRAALKKRMDGMYLSLDETAKVHVNNQMQKYDDQLTKDSQSTWLDSAVLNYGNPDMVSDSILHQKELLMANARRKGIPEESIKAGLADIDNKTHTAVLARMIADNQNDMAAGYLAEHKGEMVGDDVNRMTGLLAKNSMLIKSKNYADGIMHDAKNDEDAQAKINAIQDKELRTAVQSEYNVKLKERTLSQNNSEASVASAIANGQLNSAAELESSRGSTTDNFYQVAANSFNVKFDSLGSGPEKKKKFQGFMERWGGLNDTDVYAQASKNSQFRNDVIASKAYLTKDQFTKLISITDPAFVAEIAPKKSFIDAGIKFITNYLRHGTMPGMAADLISDFMDKATDPHIKPEDIPGVARAGIRGPAYQANPSMMNLAEPTNYVATEGNISMAYPAQSDAKNDKSLDEDTVAVIRRSDGSKGKIPRKNFDNARYKLA